MSGRQRLAGACLAVLGGLACARGPQTPAVPFVETAAASGLDFRHCNGGSGERYMVEVLGAGVALLDYDGDGDLDVFLAQGRMLGPGKVLANASFPPAPEMLPLGGRLYRNDLERAPDGRTRAYFVDVTAPSGIRAEGYGLGVATGDFDNDGWVDLYLTNYGPHQLWHNRGDGTFEEVAARAGAADDRFAVAATFFDYDRDGWLDLFSANYVDFTFANHQRCTSPSGSEDYCGPANYHALPDRLLHNRGDGSFEDATARAGLLAADGPGLGVVAADLDGDGWLDLYVANDEAPNQLWINHRDGTFADEALVAGAAVNAAGASEAGMGVDSGDPDSDGDLDLFITHLTGETNTLYVDLGGATFADRSRASGLGPPSFPFTSFGTRFFDYDNDGLLDLLTVSGAIRDLPELLAQGDPFPLHQRNQLFRGVGEGRFEEVTAAAGAAFELSEVSRGAAFGDLDGDGDTDVVITNNNGPVRLLDNQQGSRSAWLGVQVVSAGNGRDLLGSHLELRRANGPGALAHVHTDGSYASASDPRVLFGLGSAPAAAGLEVAITTPDGRRRRFLDLPAASYLRIRG